MIMFRILKSLNRKTTDVLIKTQDYWKINNSAALLKFQVEKGLKKYANRGVVLDVGAGRLAYQPILVNYFDKYLSMDIEKTHPAIDVVANMEKMPFKNNQFECVFCSQVLEHTKHPWLAIKEMKRVLKRKGILIISVPLLGYLHDAPHDYYRFTRYAMECLAKDNGLKIIEIKELGGLLSFFGYVRSSFILPLFALPGVGKILLNMNYVWCLLETELDRALKLEELFALNYIVWLRK